MISGTYQPRKLLGSNAQIRPYNGSDISIEKIFKNDHEFMKTAYIKKLCRSHRLSTSYGIKPIRGQ
jgi:hypothetical protein